MSIKKLHEVISAGAINSGIFQLIVGKMLDARDLSGLKFTLVNAMKDLRYYTNMTEQLPVTSFLAETTHQITVMADNLGYGERFVPRLIDVLMKVNGLGR